MGGLTREVSKNIWQGVYFLDSLSVSLIKMKYFIEIEQFFIVFESFWTLIPRTLSSGYF